MNIKEFDTVIFDLDKTIWNCYDKYGNSVWAKQMLQPFTKISPRDIIDDVNSTCILDPYIFDLMKDLQSIGKTLEFLSIGKRYDTPDIIMQPSIQLIFAFGLNFFNGIGSLYYKTEDKEKYLGKLIKGKTLYVDDNNDTLQKAKNLNLKNLTILDRKSFKHWNELL